MAVALACRGRPRAFPCGLFVSSSMLAENRRLAHTSRLLEEASHEPIKSMCWANEGRVDQRRARVACLCLAIVAAREKAETSKASVGPMQLPSSRPVKDELRPLRRRGGRRRMRRRRNRSRGKAERRGEGAWRWSEHRQEAKAETCSCSHCAAFSNSVHSAVHAPLLRGTRHAPTQLGPRFVERVWMDFSRPANGNACSRDGRQEAVWPPLAPLSAPFVALSIPC